MPQLIHRFSSRSLILAIICLFGLVALMASGLSVSSRSVGSEKTVAVQAAGRGNPWINLKDGRDLGTAYTGAANLKAALQPDVARPLSLASSDFDVDGYPDLICGYATPDGGILTLNRADKEAFTPQDPNVLERIKKGELPDPFLKSALALELPEAPDFLATGDFNRDGNQDVLAAARGGDSLYLLAGDGHGEFTPSRRVTLPGKVTALVAGEIDLSDRQTDVVVGVVGSEGPAALVYEGARGILADEPLTYSLPAEATSFAMGQLDNSAPIDLAVLSGGEVLILHGRDPRSGDDSGGLLTRLERVTLPFAVKSMELGEFIRDRANRTEIAVLAGDGTIYLLARGTLDTRPFTLAEIQAQRRNRLMGLPPIPEQRLKTTAWRANPSEAWHVAETVPVAATKLSRSSVAANFNPSSARPLLLRTRISAQTTEDLLVLNPADRQLQISFTEPPPRDGGEMLAFAGPRSLVTLDAESTPVAMLPMRLSVVGEPGLVILREGQVAPTLMPAAPMATFNVTTTTDCNTAGCGSLRRAITDANASGGSDMITFTNLAGSPDLYTLTLTGAEESANASGDLDINDTVTITGNGASETIIQAGTTNANGIDKVFAVNQLGGTSASATFNSVTVRFGNNNNTCDITVTFHHLGGGIDFFGGVAPTTTQLTISSSTISDNTIANTCGANVGAGISPDDGNFTISNSTVQNNDTTNSPGGGFSHTGNSRTLTMTNVTVQNNQAKGGPNGEGGGIWVRQNQNGSASISGSTITTNTAESRAGGIKLESQGAMGLGALTTSITNTTISSNTSQGINGGISEGGGVYYSTNTSFGGGTHTLNFASSGSIASNTATTGSGVFINLGSVSVTSTNMTLNNSLFIATGSMGQTTAFTAPSGTLSIGGDFTNNNTFTHNSGTVNFNGTAAQTISGSTTTTFNNLTDSNTSAALSVNNNINVNGTLTVNANATLSPSAATIIGGSGTLTGGGTAQATRTAATADFLTQYTITNKTLTNLTVDYSGAGNQTVNNSPTYGHLKVSGSSTKTLQGAVTIGGNVTLSAATFAGSSFNMNVGGNWTNNGGTFTPSTSTVTFNSTTAAQNINGSAASQTFNNITVNKTGQTLSVGGSTTTLTLNATLTLTAGTFSAGTATTINVGGNWTNNATFTAGSGTVTFNGNNNTQTLAGSTTFNNLTINHTGTGNVTATGSTLAVNSLLRVQAGTFISSSTLKDVQIDSGATLQSDGGMMNVSGNWTNNGSFTASTGTVNFNGGAAQTIAGSTTTTFNNLTDANTAAALLVNTNANASGALTVNANAVLAPAAAVIIGGGGTLTGNGTAQVTRTAATADFSNQYTITNKTLTNLTVEYIGGAAQTVSALTYGGLKISNAAGVTLAGNTTVNGLLNLATGDITTTGSFTLTQPSSAPASQGTGDVIGNAKRSNGGVLPTGTALTFGNPNVSINFASVTALTDVNINLVKSVPTGTGGFSTAVRRTYTITPTGGGTFSATLRLHYLDSELNGNTEGAGLKLWRFNGVSLWTPFANTAFDTTANWAERSGITLFSPWTLNSSGPTDVRLDAFAASGYDGGTLIEWRTGFEVDNLGFNLYRDEGGKRVAVNSQMVAGSALVAGSGVTLRAGQSYAWWDKGIADCESRIADCKNVQYWLESIDLKGQSEWHGPFSSKFIGGDGPARANSSMLGRGEGAQAGLTLPVERAALPQSLKPEQIQLQSGLAGQAAVKMWVKREGFYRVTASELIEAGLDPRADTRLLQLHADGQQIPINVISDKDGLLAAIEFYGRGLDAAFTDQRVYWLVSGSQPGLRIKQVKGAGQPTASQSFLYTAERRDRTIYFSGLRNGERENFFGPVIATSPVDQSLTLQHVDQSAIGTATIEVALQGVTTLPHKVWVYLNGAFVGETSFDGQAGAVSRFNVAQSLLRSGDNEVRFAAQAGPTDISLVDYIRLSYWHNFTADDNALRLTTPGNQEVTIGGFSSDAIRVLDVTDPDTPTELGTKIAEQKTGFAVTVASHGAGERRLLAITDDQPGKPAKLAANQPSGWRTTTHAADLVMIARREFFSAIEPLRLLRSKQGLNVELADIEDVFDEFSFGNKSPQAVKDFLLYATTSWKVKPRYVLLVGDASYDAKNYLGLGDWDLVPTRLIDTSLMETASDDALADFNADGIADLAVGRLAARTAEEASAMVRKIIGYESSEPLESMLLVADINNGFDFESASTQLRELIPGNLRVEQINRGQVDDATAKSRLLDAIGRGQKVVNYMGHGSVNLWSGSLLTNEDAGNLTNGERLPVFVMMTCLNGYFHDPSLDSLAESLLKAENGGAVAVWASTGMTEPGDQSVLNKQLYQLLFTTGNGITLGEATARAKAGVTDGDIRRTWVLLGDPTMKLR